jgi:hypothetical protein
MCGFDTPPAFVCVLVQCKLSAYWGIKVLILGFKGKMFYGAYLAAS